MTLRRARDLFQRLAGRGPHRPAGGGPGGIAGGIAGGEASGAKGAGGASGAGGGRWVCRVCGYIYDPALNGGVAFEDLPPGWRCPGCGFDRGAFRRLP